MPMPGRLDFNESESTLCAGPARKQTPWPVHCCAHLGDQHLKKSSKNMKQPWHIRV